MSENNKQVAKLNREQQLAVSASPDKSIAVIAGAGSGKTSVLTKRASAIVEHFNGDTSTVMAVTFTNKAAAEIKSRLSSSGMLGVNSMWAGTFHGIANRLLRIHHNCVGLPKSFHIIDAADQEKMVKKIYSENDYGDHHDYKDSVKFINSQKDKGLTPDKVQASDAFDVFHKKVYQLYQDKCQSDGIVDFGELIMKMVELFSVNEIRIKYQSQFRHILVDEFQDTNDIQYEWIAMMSDSGQAIPVTVVGDMDQSIYSWRGAKMENIRKFINDFPSVEVIKLETNYRSTPEILAAANQLIEHNSNRLEKSLLPHHESGSKPVLIELSDDRAEADTAVSIAVRHYTAGGLWADTAIMYRSNAQSRLLEESCLKKKVPYVIHGGLRFFDRAEIKDALAHLSILAGSNSQLLLERTLSTPPKGLGPKFMATASAAAAAGIPWPDFLNSGQVKLPEKQMNTWKFWSDQWQQKRLEKKSGLDEFVRWTLESSGLLTHYKAIDAKEGSDRAQNLMELVSAAQRFMDSSEHQIGIESITEFLASVALESENKKNDGEDRLNLMTMHAAKGLEFPIVCSVGWDETVFPTSRSVADKSSLEEERRLAYVTITRAEKKLYITSAIQRRTYGQSSFPTPSRFINEIESCCEWRSKPTRSNNSSSYSYEKQVFENPIVTSTNSVKSYWSVGDFVKHPTLGRGMISRVDGVSRDARVKIMFDSGDVRILLPDAAKIEKII